VNAVMKLQIRINDREFLDYLSDCQLLKKNCACINLRTEFCQVSLDFQDGLFWVVKMTSQSRRPREFTHCTKIYT